MIRFTCLLLVLHFSHGSKENVDAKPKIMTTLRQAEEETLAKINDGSVKGTFGTSTNGNTFIAFEGIPFAAAPVGKLRFKEPQPVKPWPGVFLANTTHTCLQYDSFNKLVRGHEDCLYLSVCVPRPKINPQERLDVIVHIHGGAFMGGSMTSFSGPKRLMDRDVIFVTPNYRVGPFGFLSAEDSHVSGNFGLKDQSFALRWIKNNIAAFGGNPNSVTITGWAAGGACVHLHYFSPMSTGLFHKGFAQSGSLNPWAVQKHPYENFKKLSTIVGCYNENVQVTLECLRQRPALQITEAISKFYVDRFTPLAPFAPVVEAVSPSSFLHVPPYTQLATNITNDLPLIISMTTGEGIVQAEYFYKQRERLNKDWEFLFPFLLEYYHVSDGERHRINKIIKGHYLKNESFTEENFANFVKICRDRNYMVGSVKAAKIQSKVSLSPVHYLLMGYGGELAALKHYLGIEVDLGVPHGADVRYYYNVPSYPHRLGKDESEMKDQLVDMLVNFAKTGNASLGGVDWKPVSDSEMFDYVLVKGPHDILPKRSKDIAPISFWSSLGLKEDENA